MIICHGLKLIFVKTKKTGGTSFEIALSKSCNADDIVCDISEGDELIRAELGFQGPVNFRRRQREKYLDPRYGEAHPNARIMGKFTSHIRSQRICRNMGEELFSSYTKVSIHRDPLDFLVSQYYYKMYRRGPERQIPFKQWLISGENYKNVLINYRIAPVDGPFAMDVVLRQESLVADIEKAASLPEGLGSVLSSLSAKGNLRDPKSRDAQEFFKQQGCEEYIEIARELVPRA